MVVMVMIFIVVMLVMVIRTDRKNRITRTSGTDRQKFLWCFIHGIVWITRSTWEERERLSNGLFVGTIKVKGDLDKKEAIKALEGGTQDDRVDSEQGAPILKSMMKISNKLMTSSSRRISQVWNWKVGHVAFQVAPMNGKKSRQDWWSPVDFSLFSTFIKRIVTS